MGGLKLFGQCAYGNNTFQKGAPLSLNEIKIPTHNLEREKRLGLVQKNGEVKICKIYRKDMKDKGKERSASNYTRRDRETLEDVNVYGKL